MPSSLMSSGTDYWMGMTESSGSWEWNGAKTIKYSYMKEKKAAGSGRCATVSQTSWDAVDCSMKRGYICKMKAQGKHHFAE